LKLGAPRLEDATQEHFSAAVKSVVVIDLVVVAVDEVIEENVGIVAAAHIDTFCRQVVNAISFDI
jgi:hypothetical protein